MTLTNDERLALFKAIDNKLNDKRNGLLTQASDSAKAELIDNYESTGADRKAILANGEKVGEVGLSYAKAHPTILADRMQDAMEYLADLDLVDYSPRKGWEEHFKVIDGQVMCLDTGEFVDWAIWEPSRVKYAAIRGCKPQQVLDALAPKLNGSDVTAYLMGGDE